MNRLAAYGVARLFAGARQGRPGMAGLGAAIGLIGWLRSRGEVGETLVYRRVLKEGETIRVRMVRDSTLVDETSVEG